MITKRRYKILADFERVHKFLTDTYDKETKNGTLVPQAFEYAQVSFIDYYKTHHIGIWEDDGSIVGISAFENSPGLCLMHTHKDYKFLLPDLLDWAELELSRKTEDGKHYLEIWLTDTETEKKKLVQNSGYSLKQSVPIKIFPYDKPFPECKLPEGFALIDGTNVDFLRLKHCWHKGFDNPGEPDDDFDRNVFSCAAALHYDMSLMTIAVAPDGEYACALGMWFDETNKYAYLEPLATVPKYRRMGLATVCLTEAMKKTALLGAKYCYVGDVEFYTAIGCEIIMNHEIWEKVW
jgi:GNAT superfamily N-acetyltransferase